VPHHSAVASCNRSIGGESSVFRLPLACPFQFRHRSRSFFPSRAYVSTFLSLSLSLSLNPFLSFSFCLHRSVNSTWVSSSRMTHAARVTLFVILRFYLRKTARLVVFSDCILYSHLLNVFPYSSVPFS